MPSAPNATMSRAPSFTALLPLPRRRADRQVREPEALAGIHRRHDRLVARETVAADRDRRVGAAPRGLLEARAQALGVERGAADHVGAVLEHVEDELLGRRVGGRGGAGQLDPRAFSGSTKVVASMKKISRHIITSTIGARFSVSGVIGGGLVMMEHLAASVWPAASRRPVPASTCRCSLGYSRLAQV